MPFIETKTEGCIGAMRLDAFEKRNAPSAAQPLGEHGSTQACLEKNRPAARRPHAGPQLPTAKDEPHHDTERRSPR